MGVRSREHIAPKAVLTVKIKGDIAPKAVATETIKEDIVPKAVAIATIRADIALSKVVTVQKAVVIAMTRATAPDMATVMSREVVLPIRAVVMPVEVVSRASALTVEASATETLVEALVIVASRVDKVDREVRLRASLLVVSPIRRVKADPAMHRHRRSRIRGPVRLHRHPRPLRLLTKHLVPLVALPRRGPSKMCWLKSVVMCPCSGVP